MKSVTTERGAAASIYPVIKRLKGQSRSIILFTSATEGIRLDNPELGPLYVTEGDWSAPGGSEWETFTGWITLSNS